MPDDNEQEQNDKQDDKQEPEKGTEESLGDPGKKALAVERQARRDAESEAKKLREQIQAIDDKDKSEVERLTEQVATLTKDRDAATSRADRLEVAVTKSLDEGQSARITSAAKRLTGATREELEADADEFLSAFAPPPERSKPVGKPTESLAAGSGDPESTSEETDIKKLGERMFAD